MVAHGQSRGASSAAVDPAASVDVGLPLFEVDNVIDGIARMPAVGMGLGSPWWSAQGRTHPGKPEAEIGNK